MEQIPAIFVPEMPTLYPRHALSTTVRPAMHRRFRRRLPALVGVGLSAVLAGSAFGLGCTGSPAPSAAAKAVEARDGSPPAAPPSATRDAPRPTNGQTSGQTPKQAPSAADPQQDSLQATLRTLAERAAPGFDAVPPPRTGSLQAGERRSFMQILRYGRCYRIVAAGGRGVRDLDLILYDADDRVVQRDSGQDPLPTLGVQADICPFQTGAYRLEVHAYAGHGAFRIAVFDAPH